MSENTTQDDSSESETEPEPAKAFHRRISTNKDIKSTKCTKDGYLLKQTYSFQRWRRRYFKLKGRKLYYAKDTKSVIYDEIELIHCSVAECSVNNVNHSFQVITPFRNLVLCADSRKEMEEWITALRSAANREFYDPNPDHRELLSGHHNWYACSHARPTYCNVCKEALSGVTSHGLSCEVCKFKVHKRCATRAPNYCKWTTLASIGKAIIEDEDGSISMPHQWLEGNLPVSAKCSVCDKTCGSVLRLQDWRCMWCKSMVHNSCRDLYQKWCSLGQCRVTILPPTAISNLDSDGFWRATKPPGTSSLLVFVNSKSGDNQGVKMLRKFKQILNPAQVFDLTNGGPKIGLRLFQTFESFRVLVCGGDGSIGWVFSEIDQLGLHKMCQVGVLPLGTGNDLARVLGWGSAFDDDTQLSPIVEKLEHAQIKMLDRWSVLTYESHSLTTTPREQISSYETSVADHLSHILNSDNHNVVINSAKVLCETVKEFVAKVGVRAQDLNEGDDSLSKKCAILNDKLDALLGALNEESDSSSSTHTTPEDNIPDLPVDSNIGSPIHHNNEAEEGSPKERLRAKENEKDLLEAEVPDNVVVSSTERDFVPEKLPRSKKSKSCVCKPRDQLMLRANSLKKAIRQIIEQTEKVVDEQNAQTVQYQTSGSQNSSTDPSNLPATTPYTLEVPQSGTPSDLCIDSHSTNPETDYTDTIKSFKVEVDVEPPPPTIHVDNNLGKSPTMPLSIPVPTLSLPMPISSPEPRHRKNDPLSPLSPTSPDSPVFSPGFSHIPLEIHITGPDDEDDDDDDDEAIDVTAKKILASLSPGDSSMACLTVPHFTFSDGDSSTCTTPGSLSPMPGNSPIMGRKASTTSTGTEFSPPASPRDANSPLPNRLQTRRISSMSMYNSSLALPALLGKRERSPMKESHGGFPLLGAPIPTVPALRSALAGGLTHGFISKVLLANADALCAAATPLMLDDVDISDYQEKVVMNNYFGIGLDAKITLDFHTKREEHPEKCRSRTKNFMWYGVIGSKEMVHKTFKNLEQRVSLECDGQRIVLPNLQGIVVLNITSYMGGTNFWGSTKGDTFTTPSFDDNILEVVAVFGSVQLGMSRVLNLQRHRIAQCRSVKITILGEEGVPVQVDGEAWVQPPGYIRIVHKNRAQMLTRDKVFEEALKTWTEKHKIERPISPRHDVLSDEEVSILRSFVDATEALIKSVKVASICHSSVDQELFHLATQASGFLDRLYPSGKLNEDEESASIAAEAAIRTQVSDLVSSVRTLYNETKLFMADKATSLNMRSEVEDKLMSAMTAMDVEMKKVYEIGGLPHFQAIEQEATELHQKRKEKTRFRLMSRLMRGGRKDKSKDHEYTGPSVRVIHEWGTEEVGQWLGCLGLGEYKEKFITNDIRGPELLHLGRTDLKELGVSKVGHLKRIQHGIKEIKYHLDHHHQ